MGLFGRARQRQEQVEREAQADFESALARAKPPTESERTWVLPTPETPDLRPPSRSPSRPAGQARPRRQSNLFAAAPEPTEEPPAPAPARRRAPAAAKRSATTKARRRPS